MTILLALITEDQFNITVTDTNVSPSNFNGSEIGTLVTLDAGPFTVTEEPYDSVAEDVAGLEDVQTEITGPSPSFSGDLYSNRYWFIFSNRKYSSWRTRDM